MRQAPSDDASRSSTASANGWFQTTHWSVVLTAMERESQNAETALAKLCQTYWFPLYSYVRRLGYTPEDSQDLTQEFLALLVHKDYLKAVHRDRGKFRSFLLMALKRFLANEWDKVKRLKRGGGKELISLDAQDTENRFLADPSDGMSPEKVYERRWALTLLELVMKQLEAESVAAGNSHLFGQLKELIGGDKSEYSYADLAREHGSSEGALRVTVHRLRRRYRELLRSEIANTVSTAQEIDDEICHLFSALA